ncbi:MAG: hisZ [Bacteroidetes bacterium]|nr:hisZ [Bacteroidota bacterium]
MEWYAEQISSQKPFLDPQEGLSAFRGTMDTTFAALPPGFRDLAFDDAASRRTMDTLLAGMFAARGFREVLPSGIEFLDVYTRGNQSISERAFKFLDREDRLLALRADFTPAVARMVATRFGSEAGVLRIWYSGNVFRRVEGRNGGYAESWQVGAELIGQESIEHDCETIVLALESLSALGMESAGVHINHAGVFRGILNALDLPDGARDRLKSEIDHKDARALANHMEELGVPATIGEQVHVLARCIGGVEVLHEAAGVLRHEESQNAIAHLQSVADRLGSWRDRVTFDLTEIDELEYYTGIMFTLFSPARRSPLGMGGRYDSLLRAFGSDRPAVGFSLFMDSILEGR